MSCSTLLLTLLALLCLFTPTFSLKIVLSDGSATLYEHSNAEFGPDTYSASAQGELVFPYINDELTLCSTAVSSYNLTWNKVLFARWGDCSPVQKALNAQTLGARALVIGDVVPSSSPLPLPAHSSPPSDADAYSGEIIIPVVSIVQKDFDEILARAQKNQSQMALLNGEGLAAQSYDELYASQWDDTLRLASIFIPFAVSI